MNNLSEEQINSNKWSMVTTIGSKCELNGFHSTFIHTKTSSKYGVYKFQLPSFPGSTQSKMPQKPTAVAFNSVDKCIYAMNTHCDTEYFQRDSNKIYTLDFKV